MIYKFVGTVLTIISALYFSCRKLIHSYCTYTYIDNVLTILQDMKIACNIGKTYKSILESWNCRQISFVYAIADKKILAKTESIFNTTGRRNKKEELEYLDYLTNQFVTEKKKYKNYYDLNKRTFILAGISLGIITVIVML